MWVWDYIEVLLVAIAVVLVIAAQFYPATLTALSDLAIHYAVSVGVFLLSAVLKVVAFVADGLQQVF